MKSKFKQIILPILLCLTIGLAPFYPEPHILSKLKWLIGGADGMAFIDWFDLALHGSPWIYLIIKSIKLLN